jgi:hypothetical protein
VRIVLAGRAPRADQAVAFEAESLSVAGVPLLPARRVALRAIWGLERAGAWLWIGAGLLPLAVGGAGVAPERLAQVEAELRARIGALPGGGGRLARIDARRPGRRHAPWLTPALALAFGAAFALTPERGPVLPFATALALCVAVGLVAEPWLGAGRALASAAAGALAAALLAGVPAVALAPLAPALGLAGTLAFARVRRERGLGVRMRSALDAAAPLGLALLATALASGLGAAALGALAAGAAVAPLLLAREDAAR